MSIFLAASIVVGLLAPISTYRASAFGASSPLQSPESAKPVEAEEYDVWSLLLANKYSPETVKELVIRERTALLKSDIKHLPSFDGAADAIQAFDERSQVRYVLERNLHLALPYSLLSKSAEDALFPPPPYNRIDADAVAKIQDGWQQFHRDHPSAQGLLTLSRVGFNRDKSIAVVYVGTQASLMSARGTCFLLRKKNGSWAIEQEQIVWFS